MSDDNTNTRSSKILETINPDLNNQVNWIKLPVLVFLVLAMIAILTDYQGNPQFDRYRESVNANPSGEFGPDGYPAPPQYGLALETGR